MDNKTDSLKNFLGEVSLFQDLDRNQLDALASMVNVRNHAAGEMVLSEGLKSTDLCIITRGLISIEFSSEYSFMTEWLCNLGPGEFFGELALLDGQGRSAMVKAKEDLEILVLGRDELRRQVREDCDFGAKVMTRFAEHMAGIVRNTNGLLRDLQKKHQVDFFKIGS